MKQWLLMLAGWALLITIWAALPPDQPNSSGHVVTGHVRDRT